MFYFTYLHFFIRKNKVKCRWLVGTSSTCRSFHVLVQKAITTCFNKQVFSTFVTTASCPRGPIYGFVVEVTEKAYMRTRFFFISTGNFLPSLGWCLSSSPFCANFHLTPTPKHVLKFFFLRVLHVYRYSTKIHQKADFMK